MASIMQAESEAALNKALAELRSQVDNSGSTEAVRAEKARVEEELQAARAIIADLQAQVKTLNSQQKPVQ